jgi:protease I
MKIFKFALSSWILIFGFLITWAQAQEVNQMKKAVMVIAHDGFRDEELFTPKEILEKNSIEVKVASTDLSPAKGMLGAKVNPDMLVSDINVMDFDAIVFIGGIGANQYWDDPTAQQLAEDFFSTGRVVAAICIAPVTLANAGILKGKRATVWSSEAGQLTAAQANYTGRPVEKDGNIITASGPQAAREFGEDLLRALSKR